MSKFETVKCDINGGVARIILNRPQSMNALNVQLMEELLACLQQVSSDDHVKVVVLSGEGHAFSSGGDIKQMLMGLDNEQLFVVMDVISDLVTTLYKMPKVTIAAIHGAAAGLGLSLALAADYVICGNQAKVAMNFIGIGLIPDGAGHFMMERRVGEVKAKQLIWEGKVMSGLEAEAIGLVDQTAEESQLVEKVEQLIHYIKQKPLKAMIATKTIYVELQEAKLIQSLQLEKQAQLNMRQTEDHQEGIQAFIEKRKPMFTGR
ncbi:enoyl-CoA hydratase [Bacillus sp. FJAT-42315]|uniref:enoyl-CoA hydratase n=1 Tax=Bacillus sp. FJAT-42315 TaxID=2014077 RepID=UPI000C23D8AC|nr:enoyl-CoA hydratase [Bacillus sp. FJAT-42315]